MNYDDMSREQLIEIAKKAKDHEIKVNPEYLAAIATSENKQAGIIDTLRKENTELREQLEAVGAGGVNGRLMPGAAPVIGADQFRDAAQMIEPCGNSGELDEREAFEAWVQKRDGFPYARQFMNLMWESWQARAALAQQDAARNPAA